MALVKLNNRGVRSATTFGSISGLGEMRFIKKQTASASSDISFVDGTSDVVLDDTYKEYIFTFKDIHPGTDGVKFTFQGSTNTGSSYGVTTTNTIFQSYHNEADGNTGLSYDDGDDIAQGTGFISLVRDDKLGADADQCATGYLRLFNPSSTTFVKHYIATTQASHASDFSLQCFSAGYFNTTSAIDAIQFKMSSGNIDAGDICLYGIN